jgi:hypothetical protein
MGRATDDNMAHTHCTLDTKGNKQTLIICNTYHSPTATMIAQMHFNVTLHVHCLSCWFLFNQQECTDILYHVTSMKQLFTMDTSFLFIPLSISEEMEPRNTFKWSFYDQASRPFRYPLNWSDSVKTHTCTHTHTHTHTHAHTHTHTHTQTLTKTHTNTHKNTHTHTHTHTHNGEAKI